MGRTRTFTEVEVARAARGRSSGIAATKTPPCPTSSGRPASTGRASITRSAASAACSTRPSRSYLDDVVRPRLAPLRADERRVRRSRDLPPRAPRRDDRGAHGPRGQRMPAAQRHRLAARPRGGPADCRRGLLRRPPRGRHGRGRRPSRRSRRRGADDSGDHVHRARLRRDGHRAGRLHSAGDLIDAALATVVAGRSLKILAYYQVTRSLQAPIERALSVVNMGDSVRRLWSARGSTRSCRALVRTPRTGVDRRELPWVSEAESHCSSSAPCWRSR